MKSQKYRKLITYLHNFADTFDNTPDNYIIFYENKMAYASKFLPTIVFTVVFNGENTSYDYIEYKIKIMFIRLFNDALMKHAPNNQDNRNLDLTASSFYCLFIHPQLKSVIERINARMSSFIETYKNSDKAKSELDLLVHEFIKSKFNSVIEDMEGYIYHIDHSVFREELNNILVSKITNK